MIELYHGTTTFFRERILREGLRPYRETGYSVWEGLTNYRPDLIYLTSDVEQALRWTVNPVSKFGGSPLVVKALLSDEDVEVATWRYQGAQYIEATSRKSPIPIVQAFLYSDSYPRVAIGQYPMPKVLQGASNAS
jgi:hypothetical protein